LRTGGGQFRGTLEDGTRDLALAHNDRIGAMFEQMIDLCIEMGTGDDLKRRVRKPCLFDDLACLEPVRDRYNQHVRTRDICRREDRALGGVALDHLHMLVMQTLDNIARVLDDDQRPTVMEQTLAHDFADATAAHDHGVTGLGRDDQPAVGRWQGRRIGSRSGGRQRETPPEAIGYKEDRRIEQYREDGGAEHEITAALVHQTEADAEIREDEGKFADLRKATADGQRRGWRVAVKAHHEKGHAAIADDDHRKDREKREEVIDDHARIEQHADGDEEQHREGVAQWQRFLRSALAQGGFTHDHAGEEGAERERDTEEFRSDEGHAQRDGEYSKAEQFSRPGVGHIV